MINRNCTKNSCDTYSPVTAEVTKSVNVEKTNTLHQFDTAGVIGLQSPVGKVPIVFYIKDTCTSAHKGIIYYDDYDTVCWMFPEDAHAEWCRQPYDMKYDAVRPFDNGVESGYRRNHGIFQLWVSVLRKWYNGQIMYRPKLKIQGCGRRDGGYPQTTVEEEPAKVYTKYQAPQTKNISHCKCGKE